MPGNPDTHPSGTLAEQVAGYFSGPAFRGLSGPMIQGMDMYVLDTLAVALGGSTAESSRIAARALLGEASGSATVFGTGRTASAAEAALVNGCSAHALELDDDHRTSVMHPGAVVVPAAFALAEATGASGREFLRGVLAGYEVAIRVGMAFEGKLYRNGFHPTAVCGVFGAAAACASILALDAAAFTRALGIAGTQAAGLIEWRSDGSWIKRLHPGKSAQSGVVSALLAREGFSGPATVFEGEFGVFTALGHGQPVDGSFLTRGLGQAFHAFGTAIKPYPCCRFSHGAIDLARNIHAAGALPSGARVTVRLFRTDVLTYHPTPTNTVDAQFNIPYLVATALLYGAIGLRDFTDDAILRPDVLDLAGRITVVEVDEFSALYPDTYVTEVQVSDAGGDSRTWRSDCPSGDPEAEAYRHDPGALAREAKEKAFAVLAECGFGERAPALVARIGTLETSPDVKGVGRLLLPSRLPQV